MPGFIQFCSLLFATPHFNQGIAKVFGNAWPICLRNFERSPWKFRRTKRGIGNLNILSLIIDILKSINKIIFIFTK